MDDATSPNQPDTPPRRDIVRDAPGFCMPVARVFLGNAPGTQAFATGLLAVTLGVVLLVLGSWLTTLLSTDVTFTRFFMMLSTVYSAMVGLLMLCGIITMLAGAIRYGVGATDR